MIREVERFAREIIEPRPRYITGTVAPENTPSLQGFLACGFRMENCVLEGICDDSLHLSNHYFGGQNVKLDEKTVRLTQLQTWSSKDYIYEGATMELWTRWYIGTPIDNVIIRGNTFTNCNTSQRDPASVAICAGKDGQPTDYLPVSTHAVTNVLFENNTVEDSTGSALAVFSAENITVRNNRFL